MGLNREADFSSGRSKGAFPAKTIAFKSIGCRTNQEETAALSRRLIDAGHRVVDKIDKAQIIIVNTCSVTAEAESKTLRFLHAVSKVASNAKICLTGCFAQRSPEGFRAAAGVHWVVGNTRKNDIPEILLDDSGGVYWGECSSASERPLAPLGEPGGPAQGTRTRFFIKIQEGCDNRCAYCIVPLLRGRSRSASFSEILTVCRKAVEAGYKEVVLTGTHIGQYREGGRGDMLSLVEAIIALPGDFRLRLSSLDPRDLTEGLLSVIANEKKVCRHLHVSVQSFSARVAAAMGRGGAVFGDLGPKACVVSKGRARRRDRRRFHRRFSRRNRVDVHGNRGAGRRDRIFLRSCVPVFPKGGYGGRLICRPGARPGKNQEERFFARRPESGWRGVYRPAQGYAPPHHR